MTSGKLRILTTEVGGLTPNKQKIKYTVTETECEIDISPDIFKNLMAQAKKDKR